MIGLRRVLVAVVCGLLATGPLFVAEPAHAEPAAISGGGSTFAALALDQWRADTARKPYELDVNYVAQGSSVGRANFASGLFDFGASDITFQPEAEPGVIDDLRENRCGGNEPSPACFVYVPVTAGGLGLMFNVKDSSGARITDLRVTREEACKIFTGQINRWNQLSDPAVQGFPNSRTITIFVRQDGAGESFVFSQFCIAIANTVWSDFVDAMQDPDWQAFVEEPAVFNAGKPISHWPEQIPNTTVNAQQGSDGVASAVKNDNTGRDSIGYAAAAYAVTYDLPVMSMQNAAGVYTQPDEKNVTVALAYATGRGDGTFELNYTGADSRAYFPSTYSYVLAQTGGWDTRKGEALSTFLCYSVGKGQEIAPDLRYARLSTELVDIAVDAILRIPGAPTREDCLANAPPPPPAPTVKEGTVDPTDTTAATALRSPGQQATAAPGQAASARAARRGPSRSPQGGAGVSSAEGQSEVALSPGDPQGATRLPAEAATAVRPPPSNIEVLLMLLLGAGIALGTLTGSALWRARAARIAREGAT